MSVQQRLPIGYMKIAMSRLCFVLLSAAIIGIIAMAGQLPASRAQDNSELIAPTDTTACLECHAESIDAKQLQHSAHRKLNCQQCHQGVNQYPHPEQAVAKKPSCTDCHAKITASMDKSAHKPAKDGKTPDCAFCHGKAAHGITLPAAQQASCVQCHRATADSLKNGAHGKAGKQCLDCHGGDVHAVPTGALTPATAKDTTCGKCHPEQGKAVAKSAHNGAISCASCHGADTHAMTRLPAQKGNAACITCHKDIEKDVKHSVHAGRPGSPSCLSCHGDDMHQVTKGGTQAQQNTSCRACHQEVLSSLNGTAHGAAGGPACLDCHTEQAHTITNPAQMTAAQRTAKCESCHAADAAALRKSVHGHSVPAGKDQQQPNCQTCHGKTMHGIKPAATLADKPELTCKQCHENQAKAITQSVHARAGIKLGSEANCLSCHGKGPHAVTTTAGMASMTAGTACISCHREQAETYRKSVHARPDKRPGDHPTCVACHGNDTHGMQRTADLSIKGKVALCSKCHEDAERMGRYGLTTEAFDSYRQSFHGRAALDFNKKNAATCTDCHGLHGILSPKDPESPTGAHHVASTCGKCHPGSQMNFALSGANHLRMKIDNTPFLHILEVAFKTLMFGAMGFLFGLVLIDLRRKLFGMSCSPECGRLVCSLIGASLLILVGGIALGFMNVPGSGYAWLISLGLIAVALVIYAVKRTKHEQHEVAEPHYPRLNLVLRIQHILLASSFILLVLTGFPLHFADVGWTHYLLVPFGGFDGARIVHRVSGGMMVFNWVWHLGYLLLLWKRAGFSLKSWTMFPTWKDARDLWDTVKYGLGISNTPPQFDRFQFREKFDYFADMWGTFVMGLSGIIMWFPTLVNKVMPDVAFGAAYIAHSYEGMLALMAIIVWHFYNTHFNPDTFPMNPAWLTGTMSATEMEREHPLEKARIDARSNTSGQSETREK